MIPIVALFATVLAAPVAGASTCSAAYNPFNSERQRGSGVAECSTGPIKVQVTCRDLLSFAIYYRYGPWKNANDPSRAECDYNGQALDATWMA